MPDFDRLKLITSAHNDTIKQLSRLTDSARERRRAGLMLLEGLHLIEAALEAGHKPAAVYVNPAAGQHLELRALLSRLDCPGYLIAEGALSRVTSLASAPEILAVLPRPVPNWTRQPDCVVLLEDLQDPGNLGTILRCAAAAGAGAVYLSKGCVDVFSPKVLRAGMGAHFALDIHEEADLAAVLDAFAGTRVVTALDGAVSLYAVDLSGPTAFVFGNEGAGVSPALQALAPARVKIPMPGSAESLNVAMAATVCLFERVRQREAPGA
ncbi:TrmH family RNA methyltransferase [Crenobacter luteus]|uniref:TrmH family RNA methyltransferase n=1 Tax=Crenobacter luteus TaxID=1452487 RepID=UPI0010443E48|nr:RNA methyltransferase [Crenobacter luteus]TCP11222.1 TrmH family RNA methyltransferase [Crenobacter luteus]